MSASNQVVQGLVSSDMSESKVGAEVEAVEAVEADVDIDLEEAEADPNAVPKFRIGESTKDELWREFPTLVCYGVRGNNKDYTMRLSRILFEAVIQQLESLPLVPLVQVTPRDFLNEIKRGILNGIEQYNEETGEQLSENNLVKYRRFALERTLWNAKLHWWYCAYTCPLLPPEALLTTQAQRAEREQRHQATVAAIVELMYQLQLLRAPAVPPQPAPVENSPSIQVPAQAQLESQADGIQNNQIQPQNNERRARIVATKAVLAHLRAQLQQMRAPAPPLLRAPGVSPQSAPAGHRHRPSIQAPAPLQLESRANGVQNNQMQAQQQGGTQRFLHMPSYRRFLNNLRTQSSLRDEGKRSTGRGLKAES